MRLLLFKLSSSIFKSSTQCLFFAKNRFICTASITSHCVSSRRQVMATVLPLVTLAEEYFYVKFLSLRKNFVEVYEFKPVEFERLITVTKLHRKCRDILLSLVPTDILLPFIFITIIIIIIIIIIIVISINVIIIINILHLSFFKKHLYLLHFHTNSVWHLCPSDLFSSVSQLFRPASQYSVH